MVRSLDTISGAVTNCVTMAFGQMIGFADFSAVLFAPSSRLNSGWRPASPWRRFEARRFRGSVSAQRPRISTTGIPSFPVPGLSIYADCPRCSAISDNVEAVPGSSDSRRLSSSRTENAKHQAEVGGVGNTRQADLDVPIRSPIATDNGVTR